MKVNSRPKMRMLPQTLVSLQKSKLNAIGAKDISRTDRGVVGAFRGVA